MREHVRRNLTRAALVMLILTALLSLSVPTSQALNQLENTRENTQAVLGEATLSKLGWKQCVFQDDKGKSRLQIERVSPCLNPEIKDFPWIVEVWKWALSIVNVFAAFVLIFMAFANILYPWQTLEPFRIRQLLPTFIWGVILANASLFISRIVVVAADILMSDTGIKVAVADLYANWGFEPGLLKIGIIPAMFRDDIGLQIGDLLFQLVSATIFIYLPLLGMIILSFLFYFRFAIIFVLSAVSPLAFGSIIFPATRGFLTRWWDMFWKWTFGGVASYLLLYLASLVSPQLTTAGAVAGGGLTPIKLIPYILSIGLVYMAIMAPFKLGGALGNMIQGLGKNLSRRAWGLGAGVTKFAASKGYHYTGVGAAKYKGSTKTELTAAKKAHAAESTPETAARLARARQRHAFASGVHGFVQAPSILKKSWGARQAQEEKLLERTMYGTGGFETIAGREAALMARKDEQDALRRSHDPTQQYEAYNDIQTKYRLTDEQMYDLFTSRGPERAQKSKDLGMETGDVIKMDAAIEGGFRNQGRQRKGISANPVARLKQIFGGPAPAGAAVAGAPAGTAATATADRSRLEAVRAGRTNFSGVDRGESIAALGERIGGIGGLGSVNQQRLVNAVAEATKTGSLNMERFHEALRDRSMNLESLTPEIQTSVNQALKDFEQQSRRLSPHGVKLEQAVDLATKWSVNHTDDKQDFLKQVDQNELATQQLLDQLADREAGAPVLGTDQAAVLKINPHFKVKFEAGGLKNDDLRHALQEQIVGVRAIKDQIEQAEQATAQELETRLKTEPTEVRVNAQEAFKIIFEGDPSVTMKNFGFEKKMTAAGEAVSERLSKGTQELKSRIAHRRLALVKETNATLKSEEEKMVKGLTEGVKVLERLQKASGERDRGQSNALASAIHSMAGPEVAATPAAPENAPIQDAGPREADIG